MKKSLMILLAILMTCLLLASCNSEVGEVSSSELVSVKIAGGSKGLGADPVGEEVTVEGLYWYYKATKVAGNPNRAGQTDWKQVKEGTGLIGASLGSFAKGTWDFEFKGFTAPNNAVDISDNSNPCRYSATCSGIVVNSATSLTLNLIEGTITNSGFKLGKDNSLVTFTAGETASYAVGTKFTLHVAENGIELIDPIVNTLTETGNTASFSTNSYRELAVGRHVLDFWVTTPDIQDENKTYVMAQGSIAFVVKKGVQYDIYGDLENLDVDYYEVTVGSYGGVTTEQAVSNFANQVVSTGGVGISAAGTASGTSGQTSIAFNSTQSSVAAKFNAVTSVKTTVSTAADIESAPEDTFVITNNAGLALGAVEIELVDQTGAVVELNNNDNITVTVQIPIVKGLGNDAQFVVQSNGSAEGISNISYNSETGVLSFTTTHFSTFVIQSDVILMTSDGKAAYKSLTDVPENVTVRLIQNLELSSAVELGRSFTLDLNNHNITATNTRALHVQEGTLTLTGTGTISSVVDANNNSATFGKSSSVIRVGDNNGTSAGLVVGKNVTITSSYCIAVSIFGKDSAGQSLVVNGTISQTNSIEEQRETAISSNGTKDLTPTTIVINDSATVSSSADYAIYYPSAGTLTVNGGTISGKGGIEAKGGVVYINGGTVSASCTEPGHAAANNNGTSTWGYALASVGNKNYKGQGAFIVNGGAINGKCSVIRDNQYTSRELPTIKFKKTAFTSGVESYLKSGDNNAVDSSDSVYYVIYRNEIIGTGANPTNTPGTPPNIPISN